MPCDVMPLCLVPACHKWLTPLLVGLTSYWLKLAEEGSEQDMQNACRTPRSTTGQAFTKKQHSSAASAQQLRLFTSQQGTMVGACTSLTPDPQARAALAFPSLERLSHMRRLAWSASVRLSASEPCLFLLISCLCTSARLLWLLRLSFGSNSPSRPCGGLVSRAWLRLGLWLVACALHHRGGPLT